ncbi:MAG: type II secretion system protein [Bermanella sp.]
MKKMNNKQSGFTLLELLVVVGIMAILGGAMISSFGGQEKTAARGAATQTIAGVENALRVFQVTQDVLPTDMESMACMPSGLDTAGLGTLTINSTPSTATTPIVVTEAYKFGGETNASGFGGGLGKKLADKFDLTALSAGAATALQDVGILSIRFADTAACDNTDVSGETATDATQGANTVTGDLVDITIPAHAFEDFREGAGRNRGRGFSQNVEANLPVMIWDAGTDGYDNTKVGAGADDVLIGLGIGQASSLVGLSTSPFAKAPFYGDVGKDKYNHYIALVNVGTAAAPLLEGAAFVQAVVDPRGDFLDEEMAEFTGQKE